MPPPPEASALLQALRSVAQSVAVAAPADGELALRTLLRALRPPDTALAQLDALLALAPEGLAPASHGSATPQVLPQVYARALALQFEDAAALSSTGVADRVDTYTTSVLLPTLSDREGVRTDPGLAWQVCRTAAQLSPMELKHESVGLGRVHAMCCAGLGVGTADATVEKAQIGAEAACMLAVSICDTVPKSDDTATLCKALFPRALALVESAGSPVALIISDLLPRLLDSLPTERPAAHAQLAALFMDLVSADGDRRASGMALGCRFAGQVLEYLRRDAAFWRVLRECLEDREDLCRKRALFLLQAATQGDSAGVSASQSTHVDANANSGGSKSKTGGKKAGKRGRRNKGKAPKVAPGWPQFIWAYQAIETSTEALSPTWAQAVEELGQTPRLIGGPDIASAIQLDVEPWVQMLIALGLRHRHPKIQQNALHAALRGTAYNHRHDALSNGDDFVLACCDLLSSCSMAASMFRDVRAIEVYTTWPIVTEVHAFMNRHVQHAPEFLRRWVHWFSDRFSPIAKCSPAAMLVWLQWLRGLPSRHHSNDPREGLRESEIASLAKIVTQYDTVTSHCANPEGLRTLARQTVLATCIKLLTPQLDAPLAALAPILAWASPSEILTELGSCDDGAGITALDWIRRLGSTDADPMERLIQDVERFLTRDEQSSAVGCTEGARSLATSIILLCNDTHSQSEHLVDSIIAVPVEILEQAHAHPYQAPGRKERAVALVASLITLVTPQSLVHRRLQSWATAESTVAAVNSALRPGLLAWATQKPVGERVARNDIDSEGLAAQARLERLTQLQEDSDFVNSTAASSLTLLGWIVEHSSSAASAASTISEVLACLTSFTGNSARLEVALNHLTQQLQNVVRLMDTEPLLANLTASADDNVAGRWRCLSAMANQPALPTASSLRVLQSAGAALDSASAETTNDIIRGVGTALTWLLDCTHGIAADTFSEEITASIEICLRNSWCTWRTHLQGVTDGGFSAHSVLLLNVQSILHKGLLALPAWSAPTSAIREIFRDMWSFSFSFTDLAPVLTWHCCSVWSEFPSIVSLYYDQAADMLCYTRKECQQPSDTVTVHACENELLTRGMLLLYLERISTAHAESLGAPMLRAVMSLTKSPVHRTPSREYDLNSTTHKVKTSVWQALCVLVQVVVPNTTLASEMHDSAVELAAWEHFPSERQYLDLFLLRLLGRCPELISRWLPAALANYELRPQIAQGILLVAGFVLLRLDQAGGAQIHLTHFKALFPPIVTWVNSGHRQLRSLAQVLVVRLVADCKARAQVAREVGDDDSAAEYDSIGADEQLISLHSYLASATEGGAFRDRLSAIVDSFDAELWCTAHQLMGRSNFVNGDGTHGDRVFTPVGKGPDSLQLSEMAECAPTACWLPEGILTQLAASLQRADSLSGGVPWEDLSIGRGRLDTSVSDAPARRELIVVASLVEKTPNIADAQFASISLQTETWLPITEVPPAWLMAYLEEQRTLGYQIIAVEQTSTSTTLEDFCWPEKAVLLLGKEKEGIPAEYLRVVDVCVEIPQLGVIRSLNVHVSGAIMCWEYVRQHEIQRK